MRKSQGALALRRAGSPDVVEREVDRWVSELRRIVVGGQVELMARVGEFLIENVYGGVEEALSHRAGKEASLRRLAERAEEFGLKPALLARAVPIALQVRQLGRPLASKLGIQQHRALLPVKDAEEKKSLAAAAVESGWSARELQKRVRRVKRPQPGGRPPEPPLRVYVRRVDRLVREAEPARYADDPRALGPVESRRLLASVNRAQALLERLEKILLRGVSAA